MTARLKILLICLLLLAAAAWFAFTRLPGLTLTSAQGPSFSGPLDQPERIRQAKMTGYTLGELYPIFGHPRPEPAEDGRSKNPPLGEELVFSVYDGPAGEAHPVTARLLYSSPLVLVYSDLDVEVDLPTVEAAARVFESEILPQTRTIFGEEKGLSEPITILNTTWKVQGGITPPPTAYLVRSTPTATSARCWWWGSIPTQPAATAISRSWRTSSST